eukprot:scaffold33654_cov101-Isochrysis_galbana.AAC.2
MRYVPRAAPQPKPLPVCLTPSPLPHTQVLKGSDGRISRLGKKLSSFDALEAGAYVVRASQQRAPGVPSCPERGLRACAARPGDGRGEEGSRVFPQTVWLHAREQAAASSPQWRWLPLGQLLPSPPSFPITHTHTVASHADTWLQSCPRPSRYRCAPFYLTP